MSASAPLIYRAASRLDRPHPLDRFFIGDGDWPRFTSLHEGLDAAIAAMNSLDRALYRPESDAFVALEGNDTDFTPGVAVGIAGALAVTRLDLASVPVVQVSGPGVLHAKLEVGESRWLQAAALEHALEGRILEAHITLAQGLHYDGDALPGPGPNALRLTAERHDRSPAYGFHSWEHWDDITREGGSLRARRDLLAGIGL